MGGTKVRKTPAKGRSPRLKAGSPSRSKKIVPESKGKEASDVSATPTPRKRLRASAFASKKSSAKKKARTGVSSTPRSATKKSSAKKLRKTETDKDDESEEEVETILRNVRELMDSGKGGETKQGKELMDALKRADVAFNRNESDGSNSDSSNGEEEEIERMPLKAKLPTPAKKKATASATPKPSDERKDVERKTPSKRQNVGKEPRSVDRRKNTRKSQKADDGSDSDAEIDPAHHKASIDALKREDPEFYKFLEENDADLLDFDDLDGSDDSEDDDVEAENPSKKGTGDVFESQGSDDEDEMDIERDEVSSPAPVEQHDAIEEISDSEMEEDADRSPTLRKEGRKMREDDELEADDVNGYSDDDEDESEAEAEAEAEAAEEAGMQTASNVEDDDSGKDNDTKNQSKMGGVKRSTEAEQSKDSKKLIFVDMKYLRGIKEMLKSSRSCLKACKDLLRLFRAGREILPVSKNAATKDERERGNDRKGKKGSKSSTMDDLDELERDTFADDGSFTSGKVKFASAKAYQQAMNLAIIGIQDGLDRILGKPEGKKSSPGVIDLNWDPTDSNRWVNLEPVFRPFVYHMIGLCDTVTDPDTLRFLLKRLEKLVPYTAENKSLLKKVLRIAIRIWSSDHHRVSEATRLRAYLLLSCLAHSTGNTETVLRSCLSVYSTKLASVCNPKTLPMVQFSTLCLVELFGIDMGASYTAAFSYLREMAISLRAVLVSKNQKEELERIQNWSFVNKLRLWSKVLGKYGSDDELGPLIYPYVQISLGTIRVCPTPRTHPMRLHIASYLTDLIAETGVFIPLAPHLLLLLRCSELRKKPSRGSGKALEWRGLLRVSDENLKTKPFLTGIVSGVVLQLAKYFAVMAKHVSFPELVHVVETTLRKTAKEMKVAEWKERLNSLAEKLRQTAKEVAGARSKADFSPHGAVSPLGMLAHVPGIDKERKMPIQRFYQLEQDRVSKEQSLRDEKPKGAEENNRMMQDGNESESSESDEENEAGPREKIGTHRSLKRRQARLVAPMGEDDAGDELVELDSGSSESE